MSDNRHKNRFPTTALKKAAYRRKNAHYVRLRTMVAQLIINAGVMRPGCHRVEEVRKMMVNAGVNVTGRSVRRYFKEIKIREKQTDINEKNLERLKKFKPKRYDK